MRALAHGETWEAVLVPMDGAIAGQWSAENCNFSHLFRGNALKQSWKGSTQIINHIMDKKTIMARQKFITSKLNKPPCTDLGPFVRRQIHDSCLTSKQYMLLVRNDQGYRTPVLHLNKQNQIMYAHNLFVRETFRKELKIQLPTLNEKICFVHKLHTQHGNANPDRWNKSNGTFTPKRY